MTIFASKAAFMQLGVEQVAPSTAHMYQDCSICKDPLDVNIHTVASDAHHSALRISICGHMHGKECLAAWLDTGNSCPTCKRMLFEASSRSVSQADINDVVRVMKRWVGEKHARFAVARALEKQELGRAQLRRSYEEGMKEMKASKAQSHMNDLMDEDEWVESGSEDFDMEDDDESLGLEDEDMSSGMEEDEEDVEDGGVAVVEDDEGSKSATA